MRRRALLLSIRRLKHIRVICERAADEALSAISEFFYRLLRFGEHVRSADSSKMIARNWKIIRLINNSIFDMPCKTFVFDSSMVHIGWGVGQ